MIFLDFRKEVMEERLLKRGETSGRNDDNKATIFKHFQTLRRETLCVVKFYEKTHLGIVLKVM